MPKTTLHHRNRALCCQCANLRTVSASYRPWPDISGSSDDHQHPDGWRCTITLKCAVCKERTRHAYLRDFLHDGRPDHLRDVAESLQHVTPGTGHYGEVRPPWADKEN